MLSFLGAVIDAIAWFFTTGWEIWSNLFAPLPFGDPYIAIAAALMICYVAHKIINPSNRVS